MSRVRPSDRISAWLRTFWIHGTWNRRTLLGAGLAYALLPVLRRVHAGDPVAMRRSVSRYLGAFNAHPYLASAAVAALGRLEAEGAEEEVAGRFRDAVSGPLGSLGDRFVWSGWRPLCALGAGAAYLLGVPAVWAAVSFAVAYNLGHLALRAWSFRLGWSAGLELGGRLRSSPLDRAGRIFTTPSVVLLGAVTVGLWVAAPGSTPGVGGAVLLAAAVAAGYSWPGPARVLAPVLILLGPLIGWLLT